MLWIKAFHLLFVISWFAGLFYLPRIFVNLAQTDQGPVYDALIGMAHRLYRFMTILAVPAIALGLWLLLGFRLGLNQGCMHAKLALVLVLVGYHYQCGRVLTAFKQGRNIRSHRYYRWYNEAPVLVLLAILILVIVRPF